MEQHYDRAAEDLGNIVGLEHVNVRVPDQQKATPFYVSGLGLTRDPYLMTGIDNMWINVGRSQFHLPTGTPQVLRGHTGLVIPDREALLRRLDAVKKLLDGSHFAVREDNAYVEATCPWGNRIRCHTPDPQFDGMTLGMPYVAFDVPAGSAAGIARFYDEVLGAKTALEGDGHAARVSVGAGQDLLFVETDAPPPDFDGHHIQVYIADFAGPHRKLLEKGLVTQESNQHQYRFQDITDLDTGAVLFTLEHEVRSMTHPLYARPLVNRNPVQTQRDYVAGHDAFR